MRCGKWIARAHLHFLKLSRRKRNWAPSSHFVRTPMTDQNRFKMPALIPPETAAKAIAKGLLSSKFELHFPKRFTLPMKLLRTLPTPLYLLLAKKPHPRK